MSSLLPVLTCPDIVKVGATVRSSKVDISGVVVATRETWALVYFHGRRAPQKVHYRDMSLDLDNGVSRWTAAVWAYHRSNSCRWQASTLQAWVRALRGDDMTPDQVATLRDLVLRLAGVTAKDGDHG